MAWKAANFLCVTDRQTDCLKGDIQEHFLHFTQTSCNDGLSARLWPPCLDRNCKLWQYFKCDYGICTPNMSIMTIGVTIRKLSTPCNLAVCHFFLFQLNAHNMLNTNHSFATTVSQLKMCDFSGGTFKGFEVL